MVCREHTYDVVQYESQPYEESHPDRLATLATLLGLTPKAPSCSRILELGCAAGNNLIPWAVVWPDSSFVGIDQASCQIHAGLQLVEKLGISNIEFKQLNFSDIDPSFGLFDYIVCHGTFSWVSEGDQERIFAICRRHLAPQGIAYVSYNTFPGWHFRQMIRDTLLYHSRQHARPEAQISSAKEIARFFSSALLSPDAEQTSCLRKAMAAVTRLPDWYVFHDLLERDNYPLYFFQFAERAAKHGLCYLTDAGIREILPGEFSAEVQRELGRLASDEIRFEQYLDFLRGRLFRRSLLCHQGIEAKRSFKPERLKQLFVSSSMRPAPVGRRLTLKSSVKKYLADEGRVFETGDELLQNSLKHLLADYPEAIGFSELMARVSDDVRGAKQGEESGESREARLASALLQCYFGGFVELWSCPLRVVRRISDRPTAFSLARVQSETSESVTNLRHQVVVLDEAARTLIGMLDGSRSHDDLRGEIRNKEILSKDGKTGSGKFLDTTLRRLAEYSLLIA